jgi:hypothetical protein
VRRLKNQQHPVRKLRGREVKQNKASNIVTCPVAGEITIRHAHHITNRGFQRTIGCLMA